MVIPAILESGIDVGQQINAGPGKFYKKKTLNKRRKLEIIDLPMEKIPQLISVGPTFIPDYRV